MNLPSGDPARTGNCPGPGVASRPDVRTRLATPGRGAALPTVADGVAYLGDADGHVQAVDVATGAVLWRHRHELRHDDGRPAASTVAPLPAVADGLVVARLLLAGGIVHLAVDGGHLHALDARTGDPRWDLALGADWSVDPAGAYEERATPFTLADGVLYAMTRDGVPALS